ncbi:MAG: hypothetical protein HC772_18745 [Leptolyngbyaceae cyanobacterium CRU_2_3]|nr:hypothetical protein [Leptolyngbyaceae cyanobacterium CRU_2_3]
MGYLSDTEVNMETEQTSQALSPKRGRLPIQLSQTEPDDLDNPPNKGLNLRSLGRTIQRQSLLIAGVATVVAGAAAFHALNIPSAYEGEFRLLVEPVTNEARIADPLTVTSTQGGVPARDTFTLDYPTQLQILQSPQQMDTIVQELRKRYPQQYPNFSAAELRSGLTVRRLVDPQAPEPTKIIQVTYRGGEPGLVQAVLDVTSEQFLQYSLDNRKSSFGQGIKFINDQLPEVQQRVSKIQDELQQLQQQYDIIDPAAQGGQLSGQINDIAVLQSDSQREWQEQKCSMTASNASYSYPPRKRLLRL